jgi:tetratricopeptide (TPR) repeat protein
MPVISPPVIEAMRRVNALLQAGSFQAAQDQLEGIVAAYPGYAEALRLLAGARQALGDAVAAEQLLRKALALDPGWTPTLATLGELLLSLGRAVEAVPLLHRALGGVHPLPRAALLLTRFYNDQQRPTQALAIAAPLCLAGKADAELAAQYVAALATLGRQQEAVGIYRKLSAAAPDNLAAAHALAIALEQAQQPEESAQVAHHALVREPQNGALYHTYARSLIAQCKFEAAEGALRDCLKREPRLVEAQSSLAQLVWMRTGDIGLATALFDQALQTFANDDALWAAKAAILQGAGDARSAWACLAPRALRPQAPPALLVRAGLAALEFDPDRALELAGRALQALPDNAAARTVLVAAQLGVGDARAALPQCEALLAGAPDDQYLVALQTTAWRLLGDERYAQRCDYHHLVMPLRIEAPPQWADMDSFLTDLRHSLGRLHDPQGHALLFQSLRNGTETSQDLSGSADPVIHALFGAFAAPIRRYLEHVGHGADPLRRRNSGRWRFNGGWSVRLRTSGFHTSHVHPRGWVSSAFYVDLPDSMVNGRNEEGTLSFGVPSILTRPALQPEYTVRPSVGMLVLFPSYFWHGTVPFTSHQPRLTVAFDVVPDRADAAVAAVG